MRFSSSWCGFFTFGAVGGGLLTYGALTARDVCKGAAEQVFDKVIRMRAMNMTAAIGSGPLLPIHLVNFTLPIKDAFADHPSDMQDDANLAGNVCMTTTFITGAVVLALVLGLIGLKIHTRHQLENAMRNLVLTGEDELERGEDHRYTLLHQ